jgi:hypothetical protein
MTMSAARGKRVGLLLASGSSTLRLTPTHGPSVSTSVLDSLETSWEDAEGWKVEAGGCCRKAVLMDWLPVSVFM